MARKSPPPVEHRFKPGTSGNPKGRPKGSKNKRTKMRTPALDEFVRYPVGRVLRRMTRREAIMRFAQDRSLSLQERKLTTVLVEANRKLRTAEGLLDYGSIQPIILPGLSGALKNIEAVMCALGLGKLIYQGHSAQRVALNPEFVTFALSLKGPELSRDEQKLVLSDTLTPHRAQWPDYWEADLRHRKVRVPERFFREDDADWNAALLGRKNGWQRP